MSRRHLAAALGVCAVVACARVESSLPPADDVGPTPTEVAAAEASATLDDVTIRLEGTRAWRVVPPPAGGAEPRHCTNLCMEVGLTGAGSFSVDEVVVEEMWVLRPDGAGEFSRVRIAETDGGLTVTGRLAPRTEPGTEVSTALLITYEGQEIWLRSEEVLVERES